MRTIENGEIANEVGDMWKNRCKFRLRLRLFTSLTKQRTQSNLCWKGSVKKVPLQVQHL